MRIVVDLHYPGHWVATSGDYDGGDPIGQGATPRDAVNDLLEVACRGRTEETDAWGHCRLCHASAGQACQGEVAAELALTERG